MEIIRQRHETKKPHFPKASPSNDNRPTTPSSGRSVFPHDAVARIYRPSRAVTTSGKARATAWRLVFERRTAPVIEPLMGYTGGDDTLTQVELSFPTLHSAIRYAERQGLTYQVVDKPTAQSKNDRRRAGERPARNGRSKHAFSDATLNRLGLAMLQESYDHALNGARNRRDPSGLESGATPMGVVRDSTLTLEAKRSILMNWAWTEYLIDQGTNEGMPENSRPSRLDEVERALLALEEEAAAGRYDPDTRKAA